MLLKVGLINQLSYVITIELHKQEELWNPKTITDGAEIKPVLDYHNYL